MQYKLSLGGFLNLDLCPLLNGQPLQMMCKNVRVSAAMYLLGAGRTLPHHNVFVHHGVGPVCAIMDFHMSSACFQASIRESVCVPCVKKLAFHSAGVLCCSSMASQAWCCLSATLATRTNRSAVAWHFDLFVHQSDKLS